MSSHFAFVKLVALFVFFEISSLPAAELEPIVIDPATQTFIYKNSKKAFHPWGFNFVGKEGTVLEEYWADDWASVEKDFRQMHELGANVVRVHLQVGTYLASPTEVKQEELERLKELLDLAQANDLYLDITGLGCYHLDRVPKWFDELSEADRWQVQAKFWEAIAETCAGHPAVFCYCLMNEPIINAKTEGAHPWLGGELGGFYFVQRICNEPGKRTREEIAAAWVKQMTEAIRAKDQEHLITVGVIPWAQVFPGAKPVFYAPAAARHLDFVSVHFYPKAKEVDKALTALKVYDIGKPIVVEETFPLSCSIEELDQFIDGAAGTADGWISHYFGMSIAEQKAEQEFSSQVKAKFLEYWEQKGKKWQAAATGSEPK